MITSVLRRTIAFASPAAGGGGGGIAHHSPPHRIHRRRCGGCNPAGIGRGGGDVPLSPRRAAGATAAVSASASASVASPLCVAPRRGGGGGGCGTGTGGRIHVDRDHHVHLGGAVPRSLVARWERDGVLSVDDEIEDLVDVDVGGGPSSSSPSGMTPRTAGKITVRRALERYRSDFCSVRDGDGEGGRGAERGEDSALLLAYQAPYPSLPVFLTMYRAYSRRHLIQFHASEISRCIHPEADVRVSLPEPGGSIDTSEDGRGGGYGGGGAKTMERPEEYTVRALEEMMHFRDCLVSPGQRLVLTVPRQTFTSEKNYRHFCSFIDLLSSSSVDRDRDPPLEPLFDFAGRPVGVELELPLLRHIRCRFPTRPSDGSGGGSGVGAGATIFYHHGELLPSGSIDGVRLPPSKRIDDTFRLLPYVDRIGHAICLRVAIEDECRNPTLADRARACLEEMARRGVGVEVCPSCNLSLGGATDLGYVREFLDAGVDVFVSTDDPGFMGGTTLAREVRILLDALNLDALYSEFSHDRPVDGGCRERQ